MKIGFQRDEGMGYRLVKIGSLYVGYLLAKIQPLEGNVGNNW